VKKPVKTKEEVRQRKADEYEAETYKEKGNASLKAGKHKSAIMHYESAIDLIEDSATYYTNLAVAHAGLKDWESAVEAAGRAREIDPTYVKAAYRYAQSLHALRRFKEALQAYEAGLLLQPDNNSMILGREAMLKEAAKLDAGKK